MVQVNFSKKFWTAVVALTIFAGPTALGAKAKSLKPAKKATPTKTSEDTFQGNGETGDKESNPSAVKKSPPSIPSMIPLETTATLGAPSGVEFFDLQISSGTTTESKASTFGLRPMVGSRVNKSMTFKLVPTYLSYRFKGSEAVFTLTTIGASGAYDISERLSIGLGIENVTAAIKSTYVNSILSSTRPVAGIEYRAAGIHSVAEIKLAGKAPQKETVAPPAIFLVEPNFFWHIPVRNFGRQISKWTVCI